MKKILFSLLFVCGCMAGFAQTTYYWVGGLGPASFTGNSNWNTLQNGTGSARSAAAATDILIINGTNLGGTVPVTGAVTMTTTSTAFSQLTITGNAAVTLTRPTGGGGTGTMTLGGNAPGEDFVIDAGSSLTLNSPSADGSVVIAMGAAATGSISGNLNISNTGQHRITVQATGGLVFNSGATATTNITAASTTIAFGSNAQSVEKGTVFLSGANLVYNGGWSPIGNNSTFSAVDMRPGSNYYHRATNVLPSTVGTFVNGKQFGNIFVENGATLNCDGPVYRIGNLNIAGGATFSTHTSGQTSVFGDLIANGTYTIPAASTNVLVLGGTTAVPQNISGAGTINAAQIVVGDNSNVVLNRNLTVATSLSVFGKMNYNNFQVSGTGTFNSRVNNNAVALAGTTTTGSYQISGIVGTIGSVNGLTVTGAGIPANTTVVGFSQANTSVYLSQPATASATGIAINFISDTATLVTAHLNGMDTLTGSVIITGTKTFQSGTNYIINANTSVPFGLSTGFTGTTINAGFVDINANVTANRSVYIYEHLGINGKFTLRVADTVHMIAGAVINGTFSPTKYIAETMDAVTGNRSLIQYENIAASTVIPVGSPANYLPVTLAPASAGAFNIAAFEGITSNGTVNGTQLTPAQKQQVVNAVWQIERTSGTGSATLQLGWQPALEGATFTGLTNSDIGIIYNTGGSYTTPLGTGDNTANTASATISNYGSYAIGSVPPSQPFIFPAIAPKTYGALDFGGGASSLNTTQPIVYTSSNPLVATIVAGNIHITGTGTTDITASQASDGFYPAATITRTLTVNKATLTITADNKTKFFNEAVPTLTFTYAGFVYGETATVLTSPVTITTTATQTSPVGVYPITVAGATAANYTIVLVNGTLTVQAQQSQTITFAALPVKTYGNADFPSNVTSTNNTIPVTLTSSNTNVATIVSGTSIHIVGAGTSVITASQAGSIGYTPAANVSQTLTVNKANLTIRVRDTTKAYLSPNPPFTITYTGFVLGQTVANLLTPPTVITTAVDNSAPGYYPLTLTGATSNNYNIIYTNGRLTILPENTTFQSINVFMSTPSVLTVRVYSPAPKLGDIQVWNMLGQPVAKKNFFMPVGFINSDLYLGTLPAGIYTVTVRGNGVELQKTFAIVNH